MIIIVLILVTILGFYLRRTKRSKVLEVKNIQLDLSELIVIGKTDSISGREIGEKYVKQNKIIENIRNGNNITLIIDSKKIKAINDSFWKGFFLPVFKELKTKERVESFFIFNTNDFYKSMITKNLTILEAICQ